MRGRLRVFLALLALWGGLAVARLYEVQVTRHDEFRARAENQQWQQLELHAPRGTIYDARGRVLAVSLTVDSAHGSSAQLGDPETVLERLRGVPGVNLDWVAKKLAQESTWFWIARKMDPAAAAELRRREIPGVRFLEESRRYYPMREVGAQVLGVVGIDNNGLEGLESRFDERLSGGVARRRLLQDARRGTLQFPGPSFREAEPGEDLHLTIDSTLQHVVERELRRALERHGGNSASAVMLDPSTGAILAMAAVPGFDANRFGRYSSEARRNRPVVDAFEPGSTFKMVTAAAALESNLVDPSDVFDCEMGSLVVAGRRIGDHKPFGLLTFREVIARSSNVGAMKVGLKVGARSLAEQAASFGFGRKTGVDLPGESGGIVHPPERWGPVETANVSFGQGVSVTPLQLAVAFAAVANGGYLMRPFVVAASEDAAGRRRVTQPRVVGRPISAATVRSLERLLEAVVEEGTGEAAAIPGYRVAGKTGTAQVPVKGGYARDRHVASFVGFVPAREPALLCLVTVHGLRERIHGGEVAAPVFAAIARHALVYLGVPPERVEAPWPPPPRGASAIVAAVPGPRAPAAPDELPDLTGLTARQAVVRSASLGLAPSLSGRGFVRRQSPAAGTSLTAAAGVVDLWLDAGPAGTPTPPS